LIFCAQTAISRPTFCRFLLLLSLSAFVFMSLEPCSGCLFSCKWV
jgi:hypothetical protein